MEIKSHCCSAKQGIVVKEQEQKMIRDCLLEYDTTLQAKTFRIDVLLPSSGLTNLLLFLPDSGEELPLNRQYVSTWRSLQ